MKTKKNVGIFLISFCIVFLLGLAFITFVDANETVAEDFKPVEEDDYCTTTAHCTTGLECDLKGTKTCQKPGSTGIGCNSTNDCNLSQNQKCDTTTKRCTDGSGREYSSCTTGGANEGGCNTQRGLKCSDYGMCVEEDKDLKKSALGQTCTDDIECRRGGTAYVCGNGKCVNETAKIVKEGENCSYKYPRAPNFNDYVCPAGTVCTHPEINSRAQYTCHQPGKKPAGDSCAGTDGKPDFSVCRIGLTCDKNKKKCFKVNPNASSYGGACNRQKGDQDCIEGLTCSADSTCRLKPGDPCRTTTECPATKDAGVNKPTEGYYCDPKTKTCLKSSNDGKVGTYCMSSNVCTKPLTCQLNRCSFTERSVELGGTCETDENCISPNRCLVPKSSDPKNSEGAKCTAPTKKTGETCTKDEECPATDKCDETTKKCTVKTVAPPSATSIAAAVSCDRDTKRGILTAGVSNRCMNCGECNMCDIMNVAIGVGKWIVSLIGLVAVFFIAYAAFLYITSMGNPEKAKAAKSSVTAAIVGLIIVFSSWALVNTITVAFGATNIGKWYNPELQCSNDAWVWKGFTK